MCVSKSKFLFLSIITINSFLIRLQPIVPKLNALVYFRPRYESIRLKHPTESKISSWLRVLRLSMPSVENSCCCCVRDGGACDNQSSLSSSRQQMQQNRKQQEEREDASIEETRISGTHVDQHQLDEDDVADETWQSVRVTHCLMETHSKLLLSLAHWHIKHFISVSHHLSQSCASDPPAIHVLFSLYFQNEARASFMHLILCLPNNVKVSNWMAHILSMTMTSQESNYSYAVSN